MTNITVEVRGNGFRYKAEGHAGDKYICGQISILSATIIEACKTATGGKIRDIYEHGHSELAVDFADLSENERAACLTALGTIRTGLEILAEQYPKNVHFAPISEK